MEIINWSGSVFGPGSEWLWTFAQFLVVLVTLLGIYRQLRSQGTANAFQRIETLQGQWESARMMYARIELALHLRYGEPDMAGYMKAKPVLDFFTDLQNLVEAHHMDIDEVLFNWGMSIRIWTAMCQPLVEVARQRADLAGFYDEMTAFAERLRARSAARGEAAFAIDEDAIPGLLDYAIDLNTSLLRQRYAAESGVIPSRPEPRPA